MGEKTTKGQIGKVILRKSTPASLLLVKGDNCFWDACAALGCESFVFGRNGIIFLSPHGTRPTEYAAPPVESGHKKHSVIITVVLPCSEWEHSQTIQGHATVFADQQQHSIVNAEQKLATPSGFAYSLSIPLPKG